MSLGRDRGSMMDRTMASILRPWSASFVGALVGLSWMLPGGTAVAASGTPLLRPDAPPAGAVVAPAPDPPVTSAPAASVGQGRPVVRPTLRLPAHEAVTPAPTTRRQPSAKTHVAASSHSAAPKPRPAQRSILRRSRLPDGFGAFLVTPVARPAADGIDRGTLALAGILLGIVTLGGGCLTLAVGRVAQER